MLSNYLKVAFRSLGRHKTYSAVTIFGLAIGLGCALLILLFVRDELSYDRHHEKHERIVRLSREWLDVDGNSTLHLGHLAPAFLPRLREMLPDHVEHTVRMLATYPLISHGDHHFIEDRTFYADSTFFEIFTQKAVKGDPRATLATVNSVVISESMAAKYFPDDEAIGKTLLLNSAVPLQVGAIMEDPLPNSHFHPEILVSFLTLESLIGREYLDTNLDSNGYSSFVLLREGVSLADFEAKLPDFIDRVLAPASTPPGSAPARKPSEFTKLHVWPITSIHLHSNLASEIEANGDFRYVVIFSSVAVFVLLIACINFMNLSTAHSARRMREVGLRKVVGASRGILVRQFLGESFLITFAALAVSLILVEVSLPWFNNLMRKDLGLGMLADGKTLLGLGLVTLATGLVAGSYPALYLSRFQPVQVLKTQSRLGNYKSRLRFSLVVVQFAISTALIICMRVVSDQMAYVQNSDLGFDRENLMLMGATPRVRADWNNLKSRLQQIPGVADVTISSRIPGDRLLENSAGRAEIDGEMKLIEARVPEVMVDHDYFKTFRIGLVTGRTFDAQLHSDSTEAFVINQTAASAIGWKTPDDAVGKRMRYAGRDGYVIGVVKDFHFESLHQPISPMIFMVNRDRYNNVVVRYQDGAHDHVHEAVKKEWQHYRPNVPFNAYYIDDVYRRQYDSDERLAQMFVGFSAVAIFIACMGLFSLASFMAERRTKEIGIRKVMGASTHNLVTLLGVDFIKPVLLAIAVSIPVAWWAMDRWLDNFAYHPPLSPWPFVVAGTTAVLIATLTVAAKTVRAARWNPVALLRRE